MGIVAQASTPIAANDAAIGLRASFARAGAVLTDTMASLLLSQLWLETGRGKSAFNNNWGNLSASAAWAGDRWPAPWLSIEKVRAMPEGARKERYLRLHSEALAGKEPSYFRSYDTPAAGFDDYVGLLLKPRFTPLLYASVTGDPRVFAVEIKATKYAPNIDVAATAQTLASLQKELLPVVLATKGGPMRPGAVGGMALAVALIAAGASIFFFVK